MIEEKYQELIQGEVDGENSPKETAAVREYLERSPEARELLDDLSSVSQLLRNVEAVEPPENLKKRILNSIKPNLYVPKSRGRWLEVPFKVSIPRRQALVAYAFLAGLLLGVVAYSFLTSGAETADVSQLYGTILRPGSSETLENVDAAEINLDLISGSVRTKASKDVVVAQMNLNAKREVEVILEFDENSLGFSGFGAEKGDANNLSVGKNYLRLTNIGQNRYFVVFGNKSQLEKPINVKILSAGSLLYQRAILTNPKSG